jgi:hypothetical protein
VAREILTRLGARPELIGEVCDIIGHHHHPRDPETTNFKAVYDADSLANLEEKSQELSTDVEVLQALVDRSLLTDSGRTLAKNVLKF